MPLNLAGLPGSLDLHPLIIVSLLNLLANKLMHNARCARYGFAVWLQMTTLTMWTLLVSRHMTRGAQHVTLRAQDVT